jgi:AcrR family transcriptional regulator
LSGKGTKVKILDAAEELFAENGFAATSIRAITSRAGVNLAALNYHFGSKEALIDSVFERRIGPLNQARLSLLDEAMREAGSETLALEDVLSAFLKPALELAIDPLRGGKEFMRLMGRAHSEAGKSLQDRIAKLFEQVFHRFTEAFQTAVPGLPIHELYWRLHFVVGAMAFTMSHRLSLGYVETFGRKSSGAVVDGSLSGEDVDAVLSRLVCFSAAGFREGVPSNWELETP